MSHPPSPIVADPAPAGAAAAAAFPAVAWPADARRTAFEAWLAPLAAMHGLQPASLRPASADASFRRYLRIDAADGTPAS